MKARWPEESPFRRTGHEGRECASDQKALKERTGPPPFAAVASRAPLPTRPSDLGILQHSDCEGYLDVTGHRCRPVRQKIREDGDTPASLTRTTIGRLNDDSSTLNLMPTIGGHCSRYR